MKKLLAILLAAIMLLSLAACGDNNTTDPDKDNPGVSQSGENNNGGEFSNWGDIFSNLGDLEGLAEQFQNGGLEGLPIE